MKARICTNMAEQTTLAQKTTAGVVRGVNSVSSSDMIDHRIRKPLISTAVESWPAATSDDVAAISLFTWTAALAGS